MEQHVSRLHLGLLAGLILLLGWTLVASAPVHAQDPPQRQIRSYIPPDQMVSFRPETPFNQFIEFLNPIFQRVEGKQIVDPESRTQPIGIIVTGTQYFDAFDFVLDYNNLTFRETDKYFIVEAAPTVVTGITDSVIEETRVQPATIDTREVEINAVLFSVNLNKTRDLGADYNVFFGGETSAGGGGGGAQGNNGGNTGGTGGTGGNTGGNTAGGGSIPRFFVDGSSLADVLADLNILAPDIYDIGTLTQFFRVLENEGVGETVANPSITVQSGETGRIQIGTDLPYVTRDFAGNTLTQFVSTGIIIDVVPTLITEAIADSAGSPLLDFIHLNVQVDNSNGQVSAAGPIVDRSTARTQVILLDGEQTIIGGLYTNDETVNRRGIPILKDIPLIRYLFSVEQKTFFQRELVILLQARLVDPLRVRSERPFADDLMEQRRAQIREVLRGLNKAAVQDTDKVFDNYENDNN